MKYLILLKFVAIISVNNAQERIVGGDTATYVVPYQVSIRNREIGHFCGGAIIDQYFILTAAHCVFEQLPENTIAIVGSNYLPMGGTTYEISKLIPHEDYDNNTSQNDIGLVKTAFPITYNKKIQPIPLLTTDVRPERKMIVSGWGITDPLSYAHASFLNVLTVHTLDNKRCADWLNKSPAPLVVYPTDICTFRMFEKGTCHGDSGGPLVYNGFLAGIVSRGLPCAAGYPDLYTKVSAYTSWINDKVELE